MNESIPINRLYSFSLTMHLRSYILYGLFLLLCGWRKEPTHYKHYHIIALDPEGCLKQRSEIMYASVPLNIPTERKYGNLECSENPTCISIPNIQSQLETQIQTLSLSDSSFAVLFQNRQNMFGIWWPAPNRFAPFLNQTAFQQAFAQFHGGTRVCIDLPQN
jgi:hypothetical protein